MISVSAPGKIILAGEHAVVYGKPALVAAVDKRLTVRIKTRKNGEIKIFSRQPSSQIKEAVRKTEENLALLRSDRLSKILKSRGLAIEVVSEIPVQAGMGSSAAVAVATVGGLLALSKKIKRFSDEDKELINKVAYQVEKKIHQNPSGIDNTISTFGGFLWFKKGKPFKRIKLGSLPRFVFVNTGKAEETTGEMVRYLKNKIENRKNTKQILRSFARIERQTKNLLLGLKDKNKRKIIKAIKECEENLEMLGVVGEFAKKLIREVERIGGGAKICGAGGIKDRSGILLCYHQKPEKIFALAKSLNLEAFEAKLGEEGVYIKA